MKPCCEEANDRKSPSVIHRLLNWVVAAIFVVVAVLIIIQSLR